MFTENPFLFSPRYRVLRHVLFWMTQVLLFSWLWRVPFISYWRQTWLSVLWLPPLMLYAYPVMYWIIPRFLLREKYPAAILILILWAVLGYFLNYLFRSLVYFPVADSMYFDPSPKNAWASGSYLTMNVMAGYGSMIVLFKFWMRKQWDFLRAERLKTEAELQLLKAQIHPHFLFNTLNNIYSFALEQSAKTPQMILELSSLLSYMLYEARADLVLLEDELEIMKNYIALERVRYGNRLDISITIAGDLKGKQIAPLIILPFLENAFKHGTSEQLEKPWMSLDVMVRHDHFACKLVNSKNEQSLPENGGIGIANVRKRLDLLYPGKHELRLSDEGSFFVVSLAIELKLVPAAMPGIQTAHHRLIQKHPI